MARKSRPWRVTQDGVNGDYEVTSERLAYDLARELAGERDGTITVWQWEPAPGRWARYEDLNPEDLRDVMNQEARRG